MFKITLNIAKYEEEIVLNKISLAVELIYIQIRLSLALILK